MTYEELVAGLRTATRELATEGRLVRAGLKEQQDTASIVERHADLYSDAALAAVETAPGDGPGPAGEARRRVRAAVLTGMVDRRTAAAEDRLTTFYAGARATVADEVLPFFTITARVAREPDGRRRDELGEAAAQVMEQGSELGLDLTRVTLEVIGELGHSSYIDFWSELKGVDYASLRAELAGVANATRGAYRAWLEPRLESFGRAYGECPHWHMSFLRGLPEHDATFTRERFEPAMRRTFAQLGLELFDAPSIHIDLEDRPAKNPRASVWPVEAGREVHLLTRPGGGNADYSAFLHEAGHALHFGLADPELGWPLANLGRSMAYAELWSYLVERIGHQPAWIAASTGVPAAVAERIGADLAGMDLMMFQRYVGKLDYELALFGGDPLDSDRGSRLYENILSSQTGFRYDPRPWIFDRDGGFYSADYLRAWLAEAALEELLRRRFGERWWAEPGTGAWLREQWRRGLLPEAEEMVAELGGQPGSGEYLAARFESRLGGQPPSPADRARA